jgi:uncharacterized protein
VLDQANVFGRDSELAISNLALSLKAHPGPEVVIWTVKSLQGEPIESRTIRAAETWKLGDQTRDDGLILLIAVQDRRLRIEVGQGLEGLIPDVIAFRQIESILVPAMRRQQPEQGIIQWILDVGARTTPDWKPEGLVLPSSGTGGFASGVGFIALMLVITFLRVFGNHTGMTRGVRSSGWGGSYGGRGLGGGGFGGGGWGGGGGGFSGGGSSGGW